MHFTKLLPLLSWALFPVGHAYSLLPPRAYRKLSCGSDTPPPEALVAIQALAAAESQSGGNSTALNGRATISVDVYFHAITNTSVTGSYPSDSLFLSQLSVMNSAYAGAGIQFKFAGSDRIRNNTLATGAGIFDSAPTAAMLAYLRSVRLGTYSSLNLYFYTNADVYDAVGACSFPKTPVPASTSDDFAVDGCHIAAGTLPGGELDGYNEGKTAVHEVGHWFSLLHTFSASCDDAGDYIADTPQESQASYGCPVGKDSCPDVAGLDPIHNYSMY
jgi:hypothetical protein